MIYLSFGLVMLAAQFSPGPDMLLLLKNAINHPLRAGFFTVAGIVAGLTVHITLAITGVSLILKTTPAVKTVVSVAGGLYLGWLAFQLLRSVLQKSTAPTEGDAAARRETPLPDRAAFLQGLITNLLNPKAALFLFTVLTSPLWVAEDSPLWHRLALAGIVLGQALLFWNLFVWLLKRRAVRSFYIRSERLLNALFGLGLATIAIAAILGPFM